MPPSFTGSSGKIVYSLKAVLSRSMRMDKKDSTKINFIPKENLSSGSLLMVRVDVRLVCLEFVWLAAEAYLSCVGIAESVHNQTVSMAIDLLFCLSLRNLSTRQRRRK